MKKIVQSVLAAALLCLLGLARADAPPQSKQAIYDAAQAAFDKQQWNAAISGFSALLPPSGKALSGTSQAVISSRLGYALTKVERSDEGLAAAERALAALPESDTTDRMDALSTAADAARFGPDFRAAAGYYRQLLTLAKAAGNPSLVINAEIGLSYALMTVDPGAVAVMLDGAMGDPSLKSVMKPDLLALFQDLRARAGMNVGDLATARTWSMRAVERSGGLTTRVTASQVAMRNDAGIIASLRQDDEDAHKYLAFTGAGHLPNANWISHMEGELPVCDELADIRPADTVIIQFAIADDGHVVGALPVYASRTGQLGEAFARAVAKWHWNPGEIAKVDLFWRATLVLQLRCQSRPTPEALGKPIYDSVVDWLKSKGVDSSTDGLQRYVSPTDSRLGRDDLNALPALLARCCGPRDTVVTPMRIRALLDANHAPPSAYAIVALREAEARLHSQDTIRGEARARADALARFVPGFQARYPNDPSVAWLQLEWALALEDAGDLQSARPLLGRILARPTSDLTDESPIRRVALLHKAIATQGQPDATHSQAQLAQAGLSAETCSLFDTHPIPASVGIVSSQFPMEALRWGFDGFVREAYDIGDDGRVANIRTIMAYPPFVFAKSTEDAVRSFRYLPPKIGDKAVGCSGETQSVHYQAGG